MEIAPIEPLAPSEELELVERARLGDEAALERLVASQYRFILTEARARAAANSCDVEDLASAGVEAMLRSVATFDPTRGTRLITFAIGEIRAAMNAAVADHGPWAVHVPGRTLRKYRRAMRSTESFEEARRYALDKEGMTAETFDAVHGALSDGMSLYALALPSGSSPSIDGDSSGRAGAVGETGPEYLEARSMLGSRGPSPEVSLADRDLVEYGLAGLSERQRAIVRLAYLNETLTDAAIAERLGLTRPTVTRDRNAALSILRARVA